MEEDRIKQLAAELNELQAERQRILNIVSERESELGKAIQLKTKIEGAIEYHQQLYKREVERRKTESPEGDNLTKS